MLVPPSIKGEARAYAVAMIKKSGLLKEDTSHRHRLRHKRRNGPEVGQRNIYVLDNSWPCHIRTAYQSGHAGSARCYLLSGVECIIDSMILAKEGLKVTREVSQAWPILISALIGVPIGSQILITSSERLVNYPALKGGASHFIAKTCITNM